MKRKHYSAPKSKKQRRAMFAKGGASCFLVPSKLKYPVCDRKGDPSCRGAHAAMLRARLQKNARIGAAALKLARKLGCDWALKGK